MVLQHDQLSGVDRSVFFVSAFVSRNSQQDAAIDRSVNAVGPSPRTPPTLRAANRPLYTPNWVHHPTHRPDPHVLAHSNH
jgi:hypothetical protein